MTTLKELSGYGESLEKHMILRTSPLAIKMLKKLVSQITSFEERNTGYRHCAFLEYNAYFPRPEFYKKLYRERGPDADDIPTWSVS